MFRRSNFGLILGDSKVDDAYSQTGNQATSDEHSYFLRRCLKGTSNDGDNGANSHCSSSTSPVPNWP
jgi:hypothetical protein